MEELGTKIILPPRFEPMREEIEVRLTPLPDPRAGWAKTPSS
jgi:glyoxalase family protein